MTLEQIIADLKAAHPTIRVGSDENYTELGSVEYEATIQKWAQAELEGLQKQESARIAKVQAELAALDLKSIRALREYVAAKPDAPSFIKQHETDAVNLRAKLK